MEAEALTFRIASTLDKPSVYMGGPSHRSMRLARQIVEMLPVETGEQANNRLAANMLTELWRGGWLPCRAVITPTSRRDIDGFVPDCGKCTPCLASKLVEKMQGLA